MAVQNAVNRVNWTDAVVVGVQPSLWKQASSFVPGYWRLRSPISSSHTRHLDGSHIRFRLTFSPTAASARVEVESA